LIWELLNRCIRSLFPKTAVFLRNVNILATEQGQWRSIVAGTSVDRHGRPLPWYTYPAIEFLDTLELSDCRVFEYGAGNSSLYWAARARTVTSVEDNPRWHEQVRSGARPNQTVLLHPDRDAYVRAVANDDTGYDVIVIDGNHRLECTHAAIARLDPGGIPRQLRPRHGTAMQRRVAAGRLHPGRFLRIRAHQRLPVGDLRLLPPDLLAAQGQGPQPGRRPGLWRRRGLDLG
jgi:hypothetical protein